MNALNLMRAALAALALSCLATVHAPAAAQELAPPKAPPSMVGLWNIRLYDSTCTHTAHIGFSWIVQADGTFHETNEVPPLEGVWNQTGSSVNLTLFGGADNPDYDLSFSGTVLKRSASGNWGGKIGYGCWKGKRQPQ